jgi:hypothetical protein
MPYLLERIIDGMVSRGSLFDQLDDLDATGMYCDKCGYGLDQQGVCDRCVSAPQSTGCAFGSKIEDDEISMSDAIAVLHREARKIEAIG